METLIFLAIAVVIAIFENKVKKSREQKHLPPSVPGDYDNEHAEDSQDEAQQAAPPRSLQDLIRQFENAQREAEQGNIEPPTPPVEEPHRDPSEPLTLRDIAEEVIGEDVIDLEFLMDTFDVDENTAAEMLMDLQAHRIVGRDMGEGECDVLVHDLDELENLLNRTDSQPSSSKKNEATEQVRQDADEDEPAPRPPAKMRPPSRLYQPMTTKLRFAAMQPSSRRKISPTCVRDSSGRKSWTSPASSDAGVHNTAKGALNILYFRHHETSTDSPRLKQDRTPELD